MSEEDRAQIETRASDTELLNALQADVARWLKDLRRITEHERANPRRLPLAQSTRQLKPGRGLAEIQFWSQYEGALRDLERQVASREVALTLAVLRQGKRMQPVAQFESDNGVAAALERTQAFQGVLRDFPL